MEEGLDKDKPVMSHKSLLDGIAYVIDFLNEVKIATSEPLEHYKYPQFIFRGISNFYPYQSKIGKNKPTIDEVENDAIRNASWRHETNKQASVAK